jgi:2,3,4,5-tetrahydropyridine-2-carboxylate N-succinyltransferase
LNPSIPVIDAETGEEVSRGYVPDYCVAVAAQRRREYRGGEFYLPCVLIIKRMGEEERLSKVALNSLLREHGVST